MEVWKLSFQGGASPRTIYYKRQGAKRRAAVATGGEAAERPMEPEAVRTSPRVFAVLIHFLRIADRFRQKGGSCTSLEPL